MLNDDRVSVSPFVIALDAVSAAENRKFPDPVVVASRELMWETVTLPPAHDVNDGVLLIDFDPAEAAFHVIA
jgi:hypothetical protein